MSTDITSLAGGPRVPVNTSATAGNNVVNLRPAARQEIAAKPVQAEIKPPAAAAAEESQASRLERQNEDEAEALRAKIEALNQNAQSLRRSLRFDVDDGTGITVITVRDRETDEVIRQIPSEELMELARYFAEVSEGQGESKGLLLRAEV
ncbi:MAG: flagellar protein FlaG [Permianibacter sp.]